MKRQLKQRLVKFVLRSAVAGCLACGFGLFVDNATGDEGLNRLFNQAAIAKKTPVTKGAKGKTDSAQSALQTAAYSEQACNSSACLIPNSIESADRVRKASHNAQDTYSFSDPTGFDSRNDASPQMVYPTPIGYGKKTFGLPGSTASKMSTPGYDKWNPNAARDEYVFDGNDRGKKAGVDQSWNVYGLETEDTIGHFDTLDGRRIVTPSNRVAVYAPRFGAVRKVDGVFNATMKLPAIALEERTPIAQAAGKDGSFASKQNLALNRINGASRASGFNDRTRGVVSDTVVKLFGVRNNFHPFENLSLMTMGKMSNSESARLNLGLQSALVWEDNLGLQVAAKDASPIVVRDVKAIQDLVHIESDDGTAILRVTKIASKIAAKTDEIVEFTIRFDNLSGKKIGNVTIIDNLTRRLEYIPNSAESSLNADFINQRNDGGSLMLRWEITDPVEANSGGIIRFKCRVR